jgi:hypothetical protein
MHVRKATKRLVGAMKIRPTCDEHSLCLSLVVAQLVSVLRNKPDVHLPMGSLKISIDCDPAVTHPPEMSARVSPGGRADVAAFMCRFSRNSGSLNFLEPGLYRVSLVYLLLAKCMQVRPRHGGCTFGQELHSLLQRRLLSLSLLPSGMGRPVAELKKSKESNMQ